MMYSGFSDGLKHFPPWQTVHTCPPRSEFFHSVYSIKQLETFKTKVLFFNQI